MILSEIILALGKMLYLKAGEELFALKFEKS
jgi:hypothetical protein